MLAVVSLCVMGVNALVFEEEVRFGSLFSLFFCFVVPLFSPPPHSSLLSLSLTHDLVL